MLPLELYPLTALQPPPLQTIQGAASEKCDLPHIHWFDLGFNSCEVYFHFYVCGRFMRHSIVISYTFFFLLFQAEFVEAVNKYLPVVTGNRNFSLISLLADRNSQ